MTTYRAGTGVPVTLQDRPDYPGQPCPIPGHGWKWIPTTGWECSDCRFDPPDKTPVTTYEEWRVTGTPGSGRAPYGRTWSPVRHVVPGVSPEQCARNVIAMVEAGDWPWVDGPHLHKRTVTVTEWEAAGPPPLNRPHPTCRDVTAIDQAPRSGWICGPECPKEAE